MTERQAHGVNVKREAKQVVVSRVVDAPPERVFRAYTEPEQLAQWFGPMGFTLPVCEIDLRPGGTWRY